MPIMLVIVGIVLILKELIPLMKARASGVIYSRGHNRKRVEKAVEPERFDALCSNRFKAMGLGALAIVIGVGWAALGIISSVLQVAAGSV